MKKHTQQNWLSIQQAADRLGVSRQRVHQIMSEMGLAAVKLGPRYSVIDRKTLAKMQRARKSGNNPRNGLAK